MLIDVSYFTRGVRRIQNASTAGSKGSDTVAVNAAITDYIKELQPEFLRSMVGEKEAGYIEDYLDLSEGTLDVDSSESKYACVCEYLKESFADYVMFHILRDSNTQNTMTGTVKLKCANTYVSPIKIQVNVWNRMVGRNVDFLRWAQAGNCPVTIVTETNMLNKINQFNL